MGLKTTLLETIKRLNGQTLTLDEFEAICKRQKRKTSNGERRMREAKDVTAVRNSKGHIIGYRWNPKIYASLSWMKVAGIINLTF